MKLRFLFAVIFLAAAYLKWLGFYAGRRSFLAEIAPQLEWMLIQTELVIGIWLLLGWAAFYSWFATLLMFGGFAGANLWMAWQGRSSCGCLGSVEFHPIWMFLIDVTIIGILLNPHVWRGLVSVEHRSKFLLSLIVLISLAAVSAAFAVRASPQISEFITRRIPPELSGQYLITEPVVIDAGVGYPNQWQTLSIKIANRSKEMVTLIGAEEGCRCRAIKSLPIEGGQVGTGPKKYFVWKSDYGCGTSSCLQIARTSGSGSSR